MSQDVDGDEVAMRRGWGRTALRVLILVVAFAALVAFSVLLAELTLTPSPASRGIAGSNLQPGHSLRQYADDYTFLGACKQVGGNLLIGAPFGIILPVLVPRRLRMVRVVLLTMLVMVLVELAQGALVEGRAFDVDDVILNTSGAIIAYALIGRIIGHKYHALAEPRPVRVRRGRTSRRTPEAEPASKRSLPWRKPDPESKPALAAAPARGRRTGPGRTAPAATEESGSTWGVVKRRLSTRGARDAAPPAAKPRARKPAAASSGTAKARTTKTVPDKARTAKAGTGKPAAAKPRTPRRKSEPGPEAGTKPKPGAKSELKPAATGTGTQRTGGLAGLLRRR